ncbi:hypothetical protein Pcinc_036063 [Petrolisthes cinctipes]|uniref:Uncharacterized protein n=1 Tax=Petrolisthes cinctipes TaxID=88211 RepID=A0AAE1BVG4_PETCI|nr:hypothetical protein Pcinc_036063 [Petrolisthes cinctipes]
MHNTISQNKTWLSIYGGRAHPGTPPTLQPTHPPRNPTNPPNNPFPNLPTQTPHPKHTHPDINPPNIPIQAPTPTHPSTLTPPTPLTHPP